MTTPPRQADLTAPDSAECQPPTDDGCTLCGLPVPAQSYTDPGVDGVFCCQGCLEVHQALESTDGIGREDVRERAETDSSRLADVDLEAEGLEEAFLGIEGMHCSTCEAFLETKGETVAGVVGIEASYATETARIIYDPKSVDATELPDRLSGYGYRAHERGERTERSDEGQALVKFLIGGGLFGMMVMVWYGVFLYPTYFGYEPVADFGGYDGLYVAVNIWLMTTFVLFYTGYPILRGAYVSLRAGVPNMDLLVATAALGAYAYSTLAMGLGRTDLYFDVSVAIVLAVTAGTYYEGRIKRRATDLLTDLTEQQVDEARREGGETVPLEAVEPSDRLLVKPGERVPLDGTVVEGEASVDESLVTGESMPVGKEPGAFVRGGTVVTDAPVIVEVGEGAESTLDHLVSLLWSIQSARPGVQRLADKLATIFVPLVLALAAGVTLLLLATGSGLSAALLVGLTVIIVSCPCALGLATPLAIAAGVRDAAQRGIVVAAETLFEDAPDIEVVVLDKTGTLTTGTMSVVDVRTEGNTAVADGGDGDDTEAADLLARAARVEALSEHPIADAIVEATPDLETAAVEGFERDRRGVSGSVDGEHVVVGHPELLEGKGLSVPADLESQIETARAAGDVPVAVGWDGRTRGVIVVGDAPRSRWRETVDSLGDGREIIVLTGDEGAAADRFRAVDAVDEVFAGVPPEAKAETVRRLRTRGPVAMVGDGSNDAPALAAADVGIAMGSGTKLATDAADAVIVGDDLAAVDNALSIAAGTNRRIRQNLGWAFTYNAIAIPLALTGLLNPLFAALAMAASSVIVVANSVRSI